MNRLPFKVDIITIFPEMFHALRAGITGKSLGSQVDISLWNPRDYSDDAGGYVDDRPYGGGPGMVMRAQPLFDTLAAIRAYRGSMGHVVVTSPAGRQFDQAVAQEISQDISHLILVCGRYEGMDQRFIDVAADQIISVGDFVCSGGELPSMLMLDSILRLIPGVLGNSESAEQDSFAAGMLDCPHYTRPQALVGMNVPPVLLAGNHADILQWRQQQAEQLTRSVRPDLLRDDKPD